MNQRGKIIEKVRLLCSRCCSSFSSKPFKVLGIESSCDDTGVSVVDSNGSILSDERHNQWPHHMLATGGIMPLVAGELHQKHLEPVTANALKNAECSYKDVLAIAFTIGPGISLSLSAGLSHVKSIAIKEGLPVLPIHHMEAHALTARLFFPVTYPFLVLLVSGGHCILAVCEGIDKYHRLGQSLDDAPGEALDKASRYLRLHLLDKEASGGEVLEAVAQRGDPTCYKAVKIMSGKRNCDFSFSGLKTKLKHHIAKIPSHDDDPSVPVPGHEDLAAWFQDSLFSHIVNRTHRAILCALSDWPNLNQIVVSGGVASNSSLRQRLNNLATHYNMNTYYPPPKYCTDNGVMIAWAGVEYIKSGQSLIYDSETIKSLEYKPNWPLGEDMSDKVVSAHVKVGRKVHF